MAKESVPPKVRLASNLNALIEMQGLTSPQIAIAAGVDRKTINNMIKRRFNPRLTILEQVANAFGLTTWQLLAVDLELVKPPDRIEILRLLEAYSSADEAGRATIMQVAEIAAKKA